MRLREASASLSGVGVALLPKAVCPMCSPAYAALLSSVGLPFLATTTYLLPLTSVFLVVAAGSMFVGAASRRGLGPFWLGIVAASSVVSGKFWLDSAPAVYAGVTLLIVASVWNAIPKRTTCPACQPGVSH